MCSQSDDPSTYLAPPTDEELDQWEAWNRREAKGFVPNDRIARLIHEVRRLRVTPQLTAENRKELLARLLRLGIDPSDFRVIGRALDDAADVDALRTEIGRKIDRLVEVEDRLAALLAARPASEETP